MYNNLYGPYGTYNNGCVENQAQNDPKMFARLYEAEEKARIELAKKAEITRLTTEKEATVALYRANISMSRDTMKTDIYLDTDGTIVVTKELFGGTKCTPVPLQITEYRILQGDEDGKKILHVKFALPYAKYTDPIEVYFDTDEIDDKKILKKFKKAGLDLGFAERIEKELIVRLVSKLIRSGKTVVIPQKSGWYASKNCLKFAFPKELTMKEVLKNV